MPKQADAVRFRPLVKEDLSRLVRWNCDPEVERFVDLGLPRDLAACVAWWEENRRSKNIRLFALEDEKGQLIGDLELSHICWRRREAELLDPDWGKKLLEQGLRNAGFATDRALCL